MDEKMDKMKEVIISFLPTFHKWIRIFLELFSLIEVYLIYNITLVSSVQHSDSIFL